MPMRPRSVSLAPASTKLDRKRSKAFLNSAAWLRLRKQVLIEQPLCHDCPAERKQQAVDVHHLQPRSSRPDLALVRENLISLCSSCHTKRHRGGPIWRS